MRSTILAVKAIGFVLVLGQSSIGQVAVDVAVEDVAAPALAIDLPVAAIAPVALTTARPNAQNSNTDPIEDALFAAVHGLTVSLESVVAKAPASGRLSKLVLIPRGSEWRYWDAGEEPPETWTTLAGFKASDAWSTGKAPLGYGQSGMASKLSFGSDKDNKHAAAFFRHEFDVHPTVAKRAVLCQMMNDDAAIVYLNGKEVFRRNLPAGKVTMETFAIVSSKPESTYWTFVIPAGQLKSGKNVLAVRVHQRSGDSSDLMHDLEAVACTTNIAKIAAVVQQREASVFTGFKTNTVDIIKPNAKWRYRYGEQVQDDWYQRDFNDSQWPEGEAPLGMGETEVKTDLSADKGTDFAVAYFRKEFQLSAEQAQKTLVGQFRFDDGAALYINGKEVLRHYVPEGPLDEATYATQKINREDHYWTFVLQPDQLHQGKNVIAFSVHQQQGSTDLIAHLYLRDPGKRAVAVARGIQATEKGGNQNNSYLANPNPRLVTRGSNWKYWDQGKKPDQQWKSLEFDDSHWDNGKAPLGYGDSHIETEISYGGNSREKHPAAYFRHTFQAGEAERMHCLVGRVLHDDSVSVFLNGKEVYRRNVPENAVDDGTYGATSAVSGADETHYWTFTIDAGRLRMGKNVLAVRVQQANASSSDLSMDLELQIPSARQLLADAILRDNEAIGKVAYVANANLVADAPAVLNRNFGMTHLSDGEVTYHMQGGERHTVVMDAVVQARQYQPNAKFARALEGDTLQKIAAREKLDPEKLRLINRAKASKVFQHREIYLQSWSYQAAANDTVAALAKKFGVKAADFAKLNDLKVDAKLKRGHALQVPWNFQHHINEHNSYLMLSMIQNRGRASTPYDRRSVKNKIHKIKQEENLAAIAKKYKITEEFLRNINGLEPEEEYRGERILVEYSVQPLKTATLADIALAFNLPVDDLIKTNGFASEQDFDPTKRIQIPYGKRMGLNNRPVRDGSFAVYEVVLGKKEFTEIEDIYAVPDRSLTKPAASLFDKVKSAVQEVAEQIGGEN